MKSTIKQFMSQINTTLGGLSYQLSDNWKLILPFILKIFTNVKKNRSEISKELKGQSGIYLWFNTINHKFYVGQASDLYVRISRYLTPGFYLMNSSTKQIKSIIRAAFIKNGSDAFVLVILEFCDKSELNKRETYWINFLKAPYNVLKIGKSSLGYKHDDDSIKKMRGARPNFSPSIEHRKSVSVAAIKENLKRKLNPEYAALINNKNIAAKGTLIYTYNLDGKLIRTFKSINQFKKEIKVKLHHNTIYKRISENYLFKDNFVSGHQLYWNQRLSKN